MSLSTLIFDLLLTIPLSLLIVYFNRRNSKKIYLILLPTIYITIISAIFPSIKNNIFLVVILEVFIRNFYITNISSNGSSINNPISIIDSILSIIISLGFYNYFLNKVTNVIPNPNEIKPFLWFIIIVFVAKLCETISLNNEKVKIKELQKDKVILEYAKLKNKYGHLIKSKPSYQKTLLYSMMIFEDYQNPRFIRRIKELFSEIKGTKIKKGIMQYKTSEKITDEDSITLTILAIDKKLKNTNFKEKENINIILSGYETEEKNNILKIYDIIDNFTK